MKAIPNILSFLRLALCPLFIYVFFSCRPEYAFLIFVGASLLDVLDGFLARKLDAISNLGKILDPLADKVLQLSAVVCFTLNKTIPLFIIIVMGLKEFIMLVGGGIISRKRRNLVYSNKFGKAASFFSSFSICLLFFSESFLSPFKNTILWVLYISVFVSVISMLQYGYITLFINKENVSETRKDACEKEQNEV